VIKSNIRPFQTSGPATVSLTGSPFTYTNTSGYLQSVLINGGLLVTLSVMGQSGLGLSAGLYCLLRPGDQVTIGYTGAPVVVTQNVF
jgi:hypothetical protein